MLRKLAEHTPLVNSDNVVTRQGLFVDVETTGLDPNRDEIIEIAMVPFTYGMDGRIYAVGEPFQALRAPTLPIPAVVTGITGISDAMVEGKSIDPGEVTAFVAQAALVIAHNAAFDRKFLERFAKGFDTKPWACSMSEVDWVQEGYEGTKLSYLASHSGFFYERHRATNDCFAAIKLLSLQQSRSGRTGLAHLLDRARMTTCRIYAENAPFAQKDILKARGYRWNSSGGITPRAWFIDVPEVNREAEVQFLKEKIYRSNIEPLVRQNDAYDRFSDRC